MAGTHLDTIKVDDEDLSDTMIAMEKSFAIKLPQDLTHVKTVGDLFDEICKLRSPDGAGDRCDTAMAFYRLRRVLVDHGLDSDARPSTPLNGQNLPHPRQLADVIKQELGLETPSLVISAWGCALALAIAVLAVGYAFWSWSFEPLALWLLAIPVLMLDPGGWTGSWETMGSLSEGIAINNVAALSDGGARSREADWWKRFSQMVSEIAFDGEGSQVDYRQIGPSTRFEFS